MLNKLYSKRNMGMTLVELIIVVAIIGILGSGMFSAVGVLSGRGARKTASSLTSLLSKAKVTTMSQSKRSGETVGETDVYLEFTTGSGDSLSAKIMGSKDESAIPLGGRGVTVTAIIAPKFDDSLDSPETISDINGLKIAFSRKNGALIPQEVIKDADGKITEKKYIKKLIVEQGSKEIVIRITPATGSIREGD